MTVNGFGREAGAMLFKEFIEEVQRNVGRVTLEESYSERYGILLKYVIGREDGTSTEWFIRE